MADKKKPNKKKSTALTGRKAEQRRAYHAASGPKKNKVQNKSRAGAKQIHPEQPAVLITIKLPRHLRNNH